MSDNFSDKCQCRIIHNDVVERATQGALSDTDVLRLVNLFKAIGDSSRIRILYALAKEEMCVCDLAAFLGISESAVSHQLRYLRQLSLVVNRREGTVLYYRLCDNFIIDLIEKALGTPIK
jgi:DNA-binding transcriptional ArsR family regulator